MCGRFPVAGTLNPKPYVAGVQGKGAAPPTAAQEVEDDTPADAKDVKGLPSLNSKPKKKAAA